ncbi:DUF2971 domain-containing protein [Leptospira sp. GIMC2001]|uniref:DUF2971 domain-containing protein n=1 Tax=Leptospira sp. GIMC2001 TaxID=1513297 RepID=UPI00234A2338|nr:DUF2971 domain-containing protein [Leptospira sp. GIMC2001]WCL50690.1 DUF2971 domain-containing protein [Leptospira sp. GIMC2001]
MINNNFFDYLLKSLAHYKKELIFPKNSYIYHYTSIDGLMGIIQNKAIYSTDARFLNDISEQNYAKNLILEECNLFLERVEKSNQFFWESVLKGLNKQDIPIIYITSFTSESDLLSMWRGYGSNTSSVALEFGKTFLGLITNSYSSLVNVIYLESEQRSFIQWNIESIIKYYVINKEATDQNIESTVKTAIQYISMLFPVLKHPAFKEEKEIRLIIPEVNVKKHEIKVEFKSNKDSICQFIKTNLSNPDIVFPIEGIIIGPTSDFENLKKSILEFTSKNNVDIYDKRIISSTIPFRY